jgi:hypothetical protein
MQELDARKFKYRAFSLGVLARKQIVCLVLVVQVLGSPEYAIIALWSLVAKDLITFSLSKVPGGAKI